MSTSSSGFAATNGLVHTNGMLPMNGHADMAYADAKLDSAVKRPKRDRTAFGLALYALSSCFLATMLVFAKRLGEILTLPLWIVNICSGLPAVACWYQVEIFLGTLDTAHRQAIVEAEVRVMQVSGASLSSRCC